jgi:hypothetical protein
MCLLDNFLSSLSSLPESKHRSIQFRLSSVSLSTSFHWKTTDLPLSQHHTAQISQKTSHSNVTSASQNLNFSKHLFIIENEPWKFRALKLSASTNLPGPLTIIYRWKSLESFRKQLVCLLRPEKRSTLPPQPKTKTCLSFWKFAETFFLILFFFIIFWWLQWILNINCLSPTLSVD